MTVYVLHKEHIYEFSYGPSTFLGAYSSLALAEETKPRYVASQPDWSSSLYIDEMELDKDVLEGYL